MTLELSAGSPSVDAVVDPDRIAQVVGNLLDNALRVSPAGGRITVEVQKEADHVRLNVLDTGPGLAEEVMEHLFDRFFQDKDTKGSSGLGLAIVKTLVELHGGSVRAGNHADGARFDVRLPLT